VAAPEVSQAVAAFAADFPVRAVPAGEGSEREQLLVDLGPDAEERPLRLELTFVPGRDEVDHLQLFIPLPFAVVPEHAGELARMIAAVNAVVPLVGFGMAEQQGWVFYRTIVPVWADRELDGGLVANTGWLAYYLVEQVAPILEDVANGDSTLDEGLAAFQAVLAGQPTP